MEVYNEFNKYFLLFRDVAERLKKPRKKNDEKVYQNDLWIIDFAFDIFCGENFARVFFDRKRKEISDFGVFARKVSAVLTLIFAVLTLIAHFNADYRQFIRSAVGDKSVILEIHF